VEPAHRIRFGADPLRGRRALFLDRDGTLIENVDYLADPDRVHVYAGAADMLGAFRAAGYALVMITNQSGIGRGLLTWEQYDAVAARVRETLAAGGILLDAEVCCGHGPVEGETCGWRKPAPGMVLEAIRELAIPAAGSLVVGDRLSDLEAGQGAGLTRFAHVATGHGATDRPAVETWGLPVELLATIADLRP
jgi:D-glycero-D-manno-heptose 1,7-bisphosphate phosphatase